MRSESHSGFRKALPGNCPIGLGDELFVTELGFSTPVSEMEYDEAYKLIADAVADIVSERPEALELLRGRTFARTLH